MLASVILLVRLPKNLGEFTYIVPNGLAPRLSAGSLVSISFRRRQALGLVFALTELAPAATESELLPLLNLACPAPLITESELLFLIGQAELYGVHPGVMLKMFLPPLLKKKLLNADMPMRVVRNRGTKIIAPVYHSYGDETERAALLQKLTSEATLVLVPEQRHINPVKELLAETKKQIIAWHSGLTTADRFARWFSIASGEYDVIIGTRDALWLPFLPRLKRLIVDEEQSVNHKNWDRAPRFHGKDAARDLAASFALQYHEMSYSPSFASFYFVHKGMFDGELKLAGQKKTAPEVARLAAAPGENNLLHQTVEDYMAKNDKDDVVLLINRRGFGRSLVCRDCGYAPLCGGCELPQIYIGATNLLTCFYCKKNEPLPLLCPSCASPLLKILGAGIERVMRHAQNLCPQIRAAIQIESGATPSQAKDRPWLLVGTDAALPHIRYQRTGLIAVLDIDQALAWPEYSATEQAWHRLRELQFYKRNDCRLVIQTRRPDHLLFRSLLEPERLYRTELNYRQKTGYPPYVGLARYLISHKNKKMAEKMSGQTADFIKKILTERKMKGIVHDPLPLHPHFFRGVYSYAVAVKLPPASWPADVREINRVLPGAWRVDPNPARLLQP